MPAFVGARRKLRLGKDPSILLNEPFDGGSLSPRKWPSIVDTGGNISVSGGELVFAGGANNWTGTRITSPPLAVVAGLRLDWDMIWSNRGGGGTDMGFDATSPVAQALVPGFLQQITLYANRYPATAAVALPLTIALNTRYYFCIICLNPGALWYVATSPYGPWALMWYRPTGYAGTLYAGITNYDTVGKCSAMVARRGLVPGPLVSVAAPTMPTPTLGAELLTDPGLEATYTAGLCNSLVKAGSPTLAESADVHGGSKAQSFIGTAQDDRVAVVMTPIANTWYAFSEWAKRAAGTGGTVVMEVTQTAGIGYSLAITSEAYQQKIITGRSPTTNDIVLRLLKDTGTSNFDTVIADDMSAKALVLASMFSLVKDAGVKKGLFDCLISTLTAGSQAGDAICLDSETNPLYYLHRYHDGTNFHLDKVENGVPTSLINTAQTWGATKVYRLDIVGTSIAAYADNTQIGTTQTVDTTSNYGTKVATFTTLATNAVTNVQVRGGM